MSPGHKQEIEVRAILRRVFCAGNGAEVMINGRMKYVFNSIQEIKDYLRKLEESEQEVKKERNHEE